MSNWSVGMLLVAIAATDLATNRFEPPHSGLALKAVLACGFLLWARRIVGLTWEALGLGRDALGSGLRYGVVAAAVIAAAIAVLAVISSTHSYFESGHVLRDSVATRVLKPLVVIPLGTVVFEEVLFRGVLLAVLLRRGSRRSAIAISSVAFGIWHVLPLRHLADGHGVAASLGAGLGLVAVTTVAGVGFAWLRLRSGSLIAPILAHIATNSFAYIAAILILTS